jgi:hypothetical protein
MHLFYEVSGVERRADSAEKEGRKKGRKEGLEGFSFLDLIVAIVKVTVTVYILISLHNDKCECDGTDILVYI